MSFPARDKALALLHVDEHVVAVDKPPGVLSVAGRGEAPSGMDLLRGRRGFAADEPLRVVHRLDKDASGVLIYARTLAAQQDLVTQFMQRRLEKVYYALVSGYVTADGEIDLPLLFDRRRNRVEVSAQRGKPSLTRYRVVQRVTGNTWLECRPLTGRMHQLRAHLAAIGHPLSVDPLYGGGQAILLSHYKPDYRPNRRQAERPLVDRLTLHAARITFAHPGTGAAVTIESPLPKDLRATLAQLGRLG
jgi:23S rRNA pseudouridine1911/1915/1917 synthase